MTAGILIAAVAVVVDAALLLAVWRRKGPAADKWALSAFVLLLTVALPVAIGPDGFSGLGDDPDPARKVTVREVPATTIHERTVTEGAGGTQTATKTASSPAATNTETVTNSDDESTWERLLSPGNMLLLRLGFAVAIAFLFAAAVQRVVLGHFEVTIGQLTIPAVTRAEVEAAAEKLGQALVEAGTRLQRSPLEVPIPEFVRIRDRRLRFIAFYLELQQRLRRLAERVGVEGDRPATDLVEELRQRGVISTGQAVAYLELLRYGGDVTAGAAIDDDALAWLSSPQGGLAVLYQLDTTEGSNLVVDLGLRRQMALDGVPGPAYQPVRPARARPGETVMAEVSVHNPSRVDVTEVAAVDASTDAPIANSDEPLPARQGRVVFTPLVTVPPNAGATWTLTIRVSWLDRYGARGVREASLRIEIEDPVPSEPSPPGLA